MGPQVRVLIKDSALNLDSFKAEHGGNHMMDQHPGRE